MNNTHFVRIAQCIGNLSQNLRRFLYRQLTGASQSSAKILPANERHRVVQQRRLRAGREKRNDVRVLQSGSELNLATESIDIDPRGEIGRQNLDDDLSLELGFCRNEYARHARAAKLAIYAICGTEDFLIDQNRARMVAQKRVAASWHRSTGSLPPGMEETAA